MSQCDRCKVDEGDVKSVHSMTCRVDIGGRLDTCRVKLDQTLISLRYVVLVVTSISPRFVDWLVMVGN